MLKTGYLCGAVAVIAAVALQAPANARPANAGKVRTAKASIASLKPDSVVDLTALSKGVAPRPLPNFVSTDAAAAAARANAMPQTRGVPTLTPFAKSTKPMFGGSPLVPHALMLTAQDRAANIANFDGLSQSDQRLADNGNQFSLEPPDQALATDGRYVLQAVNNALTVFDASGKQLIAPVSTNRFFNLQSELNRVNGQFGPSLSDPRAFYDANSKRWFVFEWGIIQNANGDALGSTFQFFAVSETSNPLGKWRVSQFDTTNGQVPGCPCIPDYQQIGFDKNGVFVTHNLFSLFGVQSYRGASVYALSKTALIKGVGSPVFEFVLPNDFTVHPAVVPPAGRYATEENGTQYFLEGLADTSAKGTASAVRVFALSNTKGLSDPTQTILLSSRDVKTQSYAEPFQAMQPDGPRPYAASLVKKGQKLPPVPLLDTGSARFASNPYFANGVVWGVVSTAWSSPSGGKSALAYFALNVSGGASRLTASVATQGRVIAPADTSLAYGSIAMPVSGRGVLGFQLSGPGNYPSTGFVDLSMAGAGPIVITGIGAVPLDGFTGYNADKSQGTERWGDYSAAGVVGTGNLWVAAEYAPDPAVKPRGVFANWGSSITNVRP